MVINLHLQNTDTPARLRIVYAPLVLYSIFKYIISKRIFELTL